VSPRTPTVAVVGAGIAGLAAAWELMTGGDDAGRAPTVHVFDGDELAGGKLRSTDFAGRTVDVAADAFLARRPEATTLCDELGLTGQLVPVGAAGASIWSRGRLRAMPSGLNLGVPTRWWPLARSGILSAAESARVARDLWAPDRQPPTDAGDRSVGEIVGRRLGRPVVERLVDPLVGGINAGGVEHLSAAATFPLLMATSRQPGSLMRHLRQAATPPQVSNPTAAGPVFWSLPDSTAGLARALTEALVSRGVTIHLGTPVEAIEAGSRAGTSRWRVDFGTGGRPSLPVDAVVLAVPAPVAAGLLAPLAPDAAGLLDTIHYASVAVVTLSFPSEAIGGPLVGTGALVPRTSVINGRPALITGCTYLGRKWPHLGRPGDELIRVSVGRFGDTRHQDLDDEALTAVAVSELSHLIGLRAGPREAMVTRWDGSFPQYDVGHLVKVAAIEQAVGPLDGLALAGAAYHGVGIPACIGSGRAAAREVLAAVAEDGGEATERPPRSQSGP
jgi:protoporphyrinogen/coproporphyrinogen III oxidase